MPCVTQVPLLADTQASQQQLMYKVMMEQQRLQVSCPYLILDILHDKL